MRSDGYSEGVDIAIVGMAGRFPGANNLDMYWDNLKNGVESISFFSEEELLDAGANPNALQDPRYVKAKPFLRDVELFDASFFGYSPKEAQMMDPQSRLFLECAWDALENSGYDPESFPGDIGIFGGSHISHYLLRNLISHPDYLNPEQLTGLIVGNDKDYLTTRVSYKLNLTGPSVTVQTACSTSLAAVHLACQSLLMEECDMALAGGVSIRLPNKGGYYCLENGATSSDGHCRTFDAMANGTVLGDGVGVVLVKRFEDALSDGDYIHAIIRASAMNNDGAIRAGFAAPSALGQAKVICDALDLANISADTIGYVEAHGTATTIGDPIEVAALTNAFRCSTEKKGFCAIGSVKTNIGHLSSAAGIAGLMKAVLALKHKSIPATLHFNQPNPKINFKDSPFYVNTSLLEWKSEDNPRRAGVNALGLGGTNVHMIIEEMPPREANSDSRQCQLLVLSAKTETALERRCEDIATYLKQNEHIPLADVAYTLQMGRKPFEHRCAIPCFNKREAIDGLEQDGVKKIKAQIQEGGEKQIAFMFSGLGDHYMNMALDIYRSEPIFRQEIDRCCDILQPYLEQDLRAVLYPESNEHSTQKTDSSPTQGFDLRRLLSREDQPESDLEQPLNRTDIAQAVVFVVEYAMAKLWMSWGILPKAMIGYSIGEYTAACLAGVLSLKDALYLVAKRGQLIQELATGTMLAVPMSETDIRPLLEEGLALAIVNGPEMCVVSGTLEAVANLESRLLGRDVACRRLRSSHAFHSDMMTPIIQDFSIALQAVELCPPQIPYVSNVTGTWITDEQVTDPDYWVSHLCKTVRFSEGIDTLLNEADVLLEVGPGHGLSSLVMQMLDHISDRVVVPSIKHAYDMQPDVMFLTNTLGKLWLAGVEIDWAGFYKGEQRQRIPLPTYPYERDCFWIEPNDNTGIINQAAAHKQIKNKNVAEWFYLPAWRRSLLSGSGSKEEWAKKIKSCLVFVDDDNIGSQIISHLVKEGIKIKTVYCGAQYSKHNEMAYTIDPGNRKDYELLIQDLCAKGEIPERIVHLWNLIPQKDLAGDEYEFRKRGFYSLLYLTKAFGQYDITQPIRVDCFASEIYNVESSDSVNFEKVLMTGICKVMPQEYENIVCRCIDISTGDLEHDQYDMVVDQVLGELLVLPHDFVVAYRGRGRWHQAFEKVEVSNASLNQVGLKDDGVYLILGGIEDFGGVFAEYFAEHCRCKLVLTGAVDLPCRSEWASWLEEHNDQDVCWQYITRILALEKLGIDVLVMDNMPEDDLEIEEIFKQAGEEFGKIDGVVYTSKIYDAAMMKLISEVEEEWCQELLDTEIKKIGWLENGLKNKKIDFCILMSSLSSVLGKQGGAISVALSIYMDALACAQGHVNIPWFSMNWDTWRPEEGHTGFYLTSEEVKQAFHCIMPMGTASQLAISTGDLQQRAQQWIGQVSLADSRVLEKPEATYGRPDIASEYVAPRTDVEIRLAEIWQDLLGVEKIGIYDNFFDLGGHSLLGTQLLTQINKVFQVNLDLRALFESHSVVELAEIVEEVVLAEIEALAEEDAARLI